MPYQFEKGQMYRMPTHFGPRTGPRRGPNGEKFENKDTPKTTTVAVSFYSNTDQLEALLPEGFVLEGKPIVSVHASYMTEIEWLAGRGYAVLGVTIPVIFTGEKDHATGRLLLVLWENLTDPIITGREELGFSKIFADLPDPSVLRGTWHSTASWMGFKFLDLKVMDAVQQTQEQTAEIQAPQSDGTLHLKYMPRTGEWGTKDICYTVLTPAVSPNTKVLERWTGDGCVLFHRARWEDMPTQYNIVNVLSDLEIREYLGASVTKTKGSKDLSDQRILR